MGLYMITSDTLLIVLSEAFYHLRESEKKALALQRPAMKVANETITENDLTALDYALLLFLNKKKNKQELYDLWVQCANLSIIKNKM